MFPELDKIISRFSFQENQSHINYPDNQIELIFIELPKFSRQPEELETITDKWIYFMKSANALNSIPGNLGEVPEINKAFEIANRANLNREELEDLEKRELFIYDQQGAIRLAKQEGMEKGMERGMEQGMERGSEERAREIARQLLNVLDDSTIAQTTGLTIEEVKKLR